MIFGCVSSQIRGSPACQDFVMLFSSMDYTPLRDFLVLFGAEKYTSQSRMNVNSHFKLAMFYQFSFTIYFY